jgi:hypothetical protein
MGKLYTEELRRLREARRQAEISRAHRHLAPCTRCGEPMEVLSPGQAFHPCCEPADDEEAEDFLSWW